MKFNWIFPQQTATNIQKKRCIDLEYQLRPRIVKFLLEQFDDDEHGVENFAAFHFDVHIETEEVFMTQDTPENYFNALADRFNLLFNSSKRLSIA